MLDLISFTAGGLGQFRKPFFICVAAMVCQMLAYVVVYRILGMFSGSGQEMDGNTLLVMSILLGGLLHVFYRILSSYFGCVFRQGYRITSNLRLRVCDRLRRLPLSYFLGRPPSEISGRLLQDMADAESIFCIYLFEVFAFITVFFLFGGILLWMNATMAMALIGSSSLALVVLAHGYRASGEESPPYVSARSGAHAMLVEYCAGIGDLKAADMTGGHYAPFKKADALLRRLGARLELRMSIIGQVYMGVLDLAYVAALAAGFAMLREGDVAAFMVAFFMLAGPRYLDSLREMGIYLGNLWFGLESLRRISSILREEPLPVVSDSGPASGTGVEFRNVRFAYDGKHVLAGVSFTIPQGTVTALVGESGGGKTTLANLLLRFWDVNAGKILIGGRDVRSFEQNDLYALFSVVFQDVYLFNDTLMNNIRLAKPEATDREVERAARLACCHDFVTGFKEGYATLAGERGSRLSGGERQRIAIARAILKDAPIVILDEATASVDSENELLIQQGLSNLTRGKTMLVIAHRLRSIREADQILVLHQGMVCERGTHDELLELQGRYAMLWRRQETMGEWRVR